MMPLLEINDLHVHYPVRDGRDALRAVDGVSLSIGPGESVALVGESGCGKTTLAGAILGLLPPSGGSVRFKGGEVHGMRGRELERFRRAVQMVFQDPFASLNPRMSVGAAIGEVLRVHGLARGGGETAQRVGRLLMAVGLDGEYGSRYPHELSGGQRQRVGIARALAVEPSLLICDEPVSALDVSVQVQILNLLKDLRRDRGIACLVIAHDLAVVRYVCERMLVMYLGRIVEAAPAEAFFLRPLHPYSQALLSAVPDIEKGLRARTEGPRRIVLAGDVPSATDALPGCPFHPRCPQVRDICRSAAPPLKVAGDGHSAVCHFVEGVVCPA